MSSELPLLNNTSTNSYILLADNQNQNQLGPVNQNHMPGNMDDEFIGEAPNNNHLAPNPIHFKPLPVSSIPERFIHLLSDKIEGNYLTVDKNYVFDTISHEDGITLNDLYQVGFTRAEILRKLQEEGYLEMINKDLIIDIIKLYGRDCRTVA